MKQAKFALTATAILAVIGGAVAFKARTVSLNIYTKGTSTLCNVPAGVSFLGGTSVVSFATKPGACITRTAITAQE